MKKSLYFLPVFYTSDTHGYLADTSGDDILYLLTYISDKVKDVRGHGADARKDRAVLLDGGDIYQGNTMSNLLQGQPLSAAYQIMEYDAVTIGNHEFDWDIENTVDSDGTMMDSHLEGTAQSMRFPSSSAISITAECRSALPMTMSFWKRPLRTKMEMRFPSGSV